MLVAPQGAYTVTDNYSLNQYAEIGLAHDTKPLPQPTDVATPGPAAQAVEADNATKKVVARRRLLAELPHAPARTPRCPT